MSRRSPVLTAALLASACASSPRDEQAAPLPPAIVAISIPSLPPSPTPPPPPAWIEATRVPEFRKCAACHRVEKGAANGLGPNLYDVFGRRAATTQTDYRYSPALAQSGLVWDFATLDRWLAGPDAVVPGTRMAFHGMRDPEERKAVIAFLRLRSAARP